ncbi:MAG TPA: glycosyltransferase [Azospirillum sp.]|nr:glycosyltransferase [Azospirillum sp.]
MTTLFVASTGGHLAQLFRLADRMTGLGEDRLWVSFDCEQTRTLLKGERTAFVPFIAERDVAGVWQAFRRARELLLRRHAVTAVVSTGSSIALSFLPYAASRGIEAHYIESAARVGQPSLTGRLLQMVPGVRLYRQYAQAAGGRWGYGGSVFDGFQSMPAGGGAVRRVVVTVGTDRGFRRLIETAAAVLPDDVEVLWQTGHTPVDGLGIAARPFVPAGELEQAVREADAVIAHAGCGSALMALAAGKHPILVPRDPQHGEVVDRHQIEIARWLAQRGLAVERTPENLTFADVQATVSHAIERLSNPPPFQLRRAQ